MCTLRKFDLDNYCRKEHFNVFIDLNCTCNFSCELDISNIYQLHKQYKVPFNALFLYILSNCINEFEFFKLYYKSKNEIYVFDELIASYNIFHDDDKTFSAIYTENANTFKKYLENYTNDIQLYKDKHGYMVKEPPKIANFFYVSTIKDLNFNSFKISTKTSIPFLQPIITLGQIVPKQDKYTLCFAMDFHHAIADGYHISIFIKRLNQMLQNFTIN